VGPTVDGPLVSCVLAESKFNVRAIMLMEFSVALGANIKSPAPTVPLAMNVTIVVVTGVAILPRKIFLRLVFKRCQSANWW
jgi:hypothetical protein